MYGEKDRFANKAV